MNCTAEAISVNIEYLPDETDNCVNDSDEPVVAVAEASAITAAEFILTSVAKTVAVLICVACLFNYVIKLKAAVETVAVICITVL